MKNKLFSIFLAFFTAFCALQPVFAEPGGITIASREDLEQFVKDCTLDAWSQGKTVNLTCDIDLDGVEIAPVPTFGGTFYGNGYTISGVSLSKSGSVLGFFRYIQEGGKVADLNVKGNIVPGGSKEFIGGLAGENAGTIERCSFEGSVKGANVVGGIAGKNLSSGKIISSSVSGSVIGENSTGGVAGKNEGLLMDCSNNAEVNTVYEEKKKELSEIDTDTGAILESYKAEQEEHEEDSVLGHTDTGGIVGYTSGVVQGCTNHAAVGYRHIGYNVGGIAGRQSGYLLGCANHGLIQGRKDVGGVVGQMEPYIILNASGTTLKDIRRELNNLHAMVNRFITDSDSMGGDMEQHFNKISGYAESARSSAGDLLDRGEDFVDDNLGEINAQAAILSNTLDQLIPVFDRLEEGAEELSAGLDSAAGALDAVTIYAPDLGEEADAISAALRRMARAEESMQRAATRARRASNDLGKVIKFDNRAQIKTAVSELSAAVKDMKGAAEVIKESIGEIEKILKTKPGGLGDIWSNIKEIAGQLTIISENMGAAISSLQTVMHSLETLAQNTEIDFSALQSAAWNMESAIGSLANAARYIMQGLVDIGDSIERVSDIASEYADDVSAQLNEAKDGLSDAVSSMSYAADDIREAIDDAGQILSGLSDEKTLEFVKLGDGFRASSDNLMQSLADISGELDALKNTVSDGRETVAGNVSAISNQFNLIMNLMIGELEELENGGDGISDLFLDTSDEDIANTRQGKVFECQNMGRIEGDRNIGGIVGAMAVEYSKDPEDDIEKPDTLKFSYKTKAVLQRCTNDGGITGKKDCIGGIAGLAEIGTVYECENYGDAKSTGGNYVGGVAGKSEANVRKNYAKCKVAGKRYVGGIAGRADSLAACCSIASVSGDEGLGAVCGMGNSREHMYQNYFVDNGLGAIDGVSYSGAAEPVSYEWLKGLSGIPKRFISFSVTFLADGELVETQEIRYGDDTARIKYPDIPDKEGHFGNWQTPGSKTVTEDIVIECVYEPYITILASSEKNSSGKLPLALAEGNFTDKAELHVTPSSITPPAEVHGSAQVFHLSLSHVDSKDAASVKVRILNENRDKATVWRMQDGEWKQADASVRGKYVILDAAGAETVFCIKYEKKAFQFMYFLFAAIAAGVICVWIVRKKRNRKKESGANISSPQG